MDVADGRNVDRTGDRIEGRFDRVTVVHDNDVLGYVAVDVAADVTDEDAVLDAIEELDGVTHVEPNVRSKAVDPRVGTDPYSATIGVGQSDEPTDGETYRPSDPLFTDQYAPGMVEVPKAWSKTFGDEDISIAILDTGVDVDHPDLAGQFREDIGTDFVAGDDDPTPRVPTEQHGTRVAGTLAAQINDQFGTAGICDATLFVGRILDSDAYGFTSDLVDGIQWAADEGADIINMSVHFDPTKQLRNAVEYAQEQGVLLVAASGNDGEEEDVVNYPARYDGVLAVGAVDEDYDVTYFSQGGPNLDVVAPGDDVLSPAVQGGGYENHERWGGTSASTPIASGVAALALSVAPESSPEDLYEYVVEGAVRLDEPGRAQGDGLVNADYTVDLARGVIPDIDGHPFESEIRTLVDEGVISGYHDGWFRPERGLTRAEFATMIANAFDLDPDQRPDFDDVDGHWAEENIRTVAGADFFGGYPDGTFRPDQKVTKAEAIVSLSSGLGYSGGDTSVLSDAYADAEEIPDWARQGIANAHEAWDGIESYPDRGAITPYAGTTRAEAAKYVYDASRETGQQPDESGEHTETRTGTVEAGDQTTLEYRVRTSGEVELDLSGPRDGDLDMYVTLDARQPTKDDYDKVSRSFDSSEQILVDSNDDLEATNIAILVTAYGKGGGDYELTITERFPES